MPALNPERNSPWSTSSPPSSPLPATPTRSATPRRRRDTGRVWTRVTSSRLIGRTAELQQLEAALADASSGRPSLAFVAGDSGVGKTRLLNEFVARARESGARVLSGDAVELGEGELPYAALVGALRPLARAGDPVLETLDPRARAELARLLPGLAGAAPAGGPAPAVAADEPDQGRLFEALLSLLDHMGAEQPVVLALEDLHWADRSTRAFVAYLARSLCRERVLVIGTYRLDELHRRHPLRPLLAELERDANARRVTLPPLTRDELAAALEDILGAPPATDLRDRLYTRSEGNPLYMEELLAAGLEGRPDALSATLRDALMVRIERLGEDAREVMRVPAVGRWLAPSRMGETRGLEPAVLRAALREAVASHIVVAGDDDYYRFRHALLREVVEDDLLPGERTELHLAIAQMLERRDTNPQLAAGIALHYAAAGDQPAALAAAVRAAQAAESVHAYGDAAAMYERALELWDRVADPESLTGGDRIALLRATAEVHLAAGEHTRPEPLLRHAIELVDESADPLRAAGLLERLALAQWRTVGGEEEALSSARRALALVEDGEPSPERAAILAWWAKTRMLQGRYREAVRAAREAIDAAEAGGNPAARSTALNAMGVALAGQGAVDEGAAALRKAIEIARDEHRASELESAYVNLSDVLHLAGRDREALDVVREAIEQAPLVGYKTNWLKIVVTELETELGHWDEAAAALPEPERRLSGVVLVNVELKRAELALGRGEHDAAADPLARIEEYVLASSEPQWHGPFGSLCAELRRRQGDLD